MLKKLTILLALVLLFKLGFQNLPETTEIPESGTIATATTTPKRPAVAKTTKVAKVTRVIDGDTVELSTGERLRYIGMDTPELKGKDCYSQEATAKNKSLVEGKEVELEKDVSETDRYGRLLRYVYVEGQMVNRILLQEGFAKVATFPPDVRYQETFWGDERQARENGRGLWGGACAVDLEETEVIEEVEPTTSFSCNCKKTCTQIQTCEEAYFQLNVCGCNKRDGDNNGVPCESLCE